MRRIQETESKIQEEGGRQHEARVVGRWARGDGNKESDQNRTDSEFWSYFSEAHEP